MKIDHGTLVAVLDGEKLLLFRNEGDAAIPVLATIHHEESENGPTRSSGSDAPGRVRASADERRSSYGDTDWHEQAEARFAAHAAEVIERHAAAGEGAVVIAAAPRTLGQLRPHYGRETAQRLAGELDKELARHETDDIARAIAEA